MQPERWQRIKDVFNAVLDMPAAERSVYLASECANDADLRTEVESLLRSHEADDAFLESSALSALDLAADAATTTGAGGMIGPYRVLRSIGSGGMGVVLEAERADEQYHKRVAIKLIRRGMDSDLILKRFRQERQILAALDHPNIARLLDGGMTAEGQPYLVMEYIDGVNIDEYVRQQALPVDTVLALFRDVCAAVHFAHQNLVVHRDLKPSNILVTPDGHVKLLDFGVAKLLKPDDTGGPTLTVEGARALTPAYASPEQLRGEPTTTASDVYSLGVTLYHLLTGHTPYGRDSSYQQIIDSVLSQDEPVRPSGAVVSGRSATRSEPVTRELQRRLSGELDNIVLMAMRKERERRYPSAAALSDDLGRFLEGHPVLAQQDTATYRMRKFVQRHAAMVSAGLLLALTLFAGIAATLWQSREANVARAAAEQRLVDVRALTRTMIFEVYDAINDVPGTTAARELVVTRAFEYLDRLAAGSRDPVLLREVVDAYLRLAAVQGQPSGANRGDIAAAHKTLERALVVADELVTHDPNDMKSQRSLALVNEKLADIQANRGDVAGGVARARVALAAFTAIARAQPNDTRAQLSMAISNIKLADLLGNSNFPNLGDKEGALKGYSTSRDILENAPLKGSNDPSVRRYIGLVQERLATMLESVSDWKGAEEAYLRSLAIREKTAADSGAGASARRDVAVTLQNLCDVRAHMGRKDEAADNCEQARTIFLALRAADSNNVQGIEDLARIQESMAQAASVAGNIAAALKELARTVDYRETLLKTHPDNTQNCRRLANALLDIAEWQLKLAADDGAAAAAARGSALVAHRRATELVRTLSTQKVDVARENERLLTLSRVLSARSDHPITQPH